MWVGAALTYREAVDEGFAGRDAAEAQPRHAVHRRGRAHAVPMDRARLAQAVGDGKGQATGIRNVGRSRKIRRSFSRKGAAKKVNRSGLEPSHHLSGTDGSNPAPSSGESSELRCCRGSPC
jgi:hypothetical protein